MSVLRILLLACALMWLPAFSAEPDATHRELARRLLEAIQAGDEASLGELANNPVLFDAEALRLLTRDARSVLRGSRVLTRIDAREQPDGSLVIDIVYLPEHRAASFDALDRAVREGRARMFVDYIACRFEQRGAALSMPHACFAETDAYD